MYTEPMFGRSRFIKHSSNNCLLFQHISCWTYGQRFDECLLEQLLYILVKGKPCHQTFFQQLFSCSSACASKVWTIIGLQLTFLKHELRATPFTSSSTLGNAQTFMKRLPDAPAEPFPLAMVAERTDGWEPIAKRRAGNNLIRNGYGIDIYIYIHVHIDIHKYIYIYIYSLIYI
jgi:hypothetical protein